ncbi:MAG TPA: hypothetical protein VFD66_10625, partial [Verrucomicrobiae bacterium]|nr:hypothetical protein [Verrucomicrobiae bacterium]
MNSINSHQEKTVGTLKGSTMLALIIVVLLGSIALFIYSITEGIRAQNHPFWPLFVFSILSEITGIVLATGFFTLQPNEARVLILFGAYKGSVRDSGFHWSNPFYSNNTQGRLRAALQQHGKSKSEPESAQSFRATLPRYKIS